MSLNEALVKRDLAVLWHPCTQMKDHESLPLIPIKSGQGIWLHDFDGNRYIDAISSWWVNLFGHNHPAITDALTKQANQLEHVILAGFTHEPAIQLAENLVRITPSGLDKVFYTDNGSSCIEAALKMSFHYWKNLGRNNKQKFVTLSNSYHGETLGALAVGNVALYKETYGPLLLEPITVESPDCYFRDSEQSWKDYTQKHFLNHMLPTLEKHANDIAAVIVEPLVQCAGSMRMYHPVYLRLLREACDRLDIHIIADEIAVGFGRTGTLFACEQASITPDFMCLSKGLTGGYLPLAALLTSNTVYDAFYDNYESMRAFLHSHSYTGNALACSVANAVIAQFDQSPVIENNQRLAAIIRQGLSVLEEHPHVSEIRQSGMITAVELVKDKRTKEPFPWQERRGLKVYRHGLANECLLRPLGNVCYLMPPYTINDDELSHVISVLIAGIDHATCT